MKTEIKENIKKNINNKSICLVAKTTFSFLLRWSKKSKTEIKIYKTMQAMSHVDEKDN